MLIVLWPIVLMVGIGGWGLATGRLLRRSTGVVLADAASVITMGITSILAISGLLLAVDLGRVLPWLVVVGLVFSIGELTMHYRHNGVPAAPLRREVAIGMGILLVVLLVAMTQSIDANWMIADDPNYLYLAKRITDVGDLVDPGNLRRIQSLGGMSALQALHLWGQPGDYLRFADFWLGSVLIVTSLWRAGDRKWSLPGLAVASGLLVTYGTMTGMNFNSSPIILPVGLLLVLTRLCVAMRIDSNPRACAGLAALVGAIAMVMMSFRPYLGVPLIPLIGLFCLWPPLNRVTVARSLGAVAGALVFLSGWMVAAARGAGTPIYPLSSGNTDPTFPTLGNRVIPIDAPELAWRVVGAFVSPLWIVVIVIGFVALVRSRRAESAQADVVDSHRWTLRFIVITVVVMGLWLVGFTLIFWNFGLPSGPFLTRYFAPILLGVALVPLATLIRMKSVSDAQGHRVEIGVIAVVLVVFLALNSFGVSQIMGRSISRLASGAAFDAEANEQFADKRADYDAARLLLPPGRKVFTAVDNPVFLLGSDATIHTLDLVGFASDRPHLPYFTGDQTKLDWLREHHYDFLVAMMPERSAAMYASELAKRGALEPDLKAWSAPWQPYVTDWSDFVGRLAERAPEGATIVGDLVVVPLT